MNLSTARSVKRAKEVGVRKAVGSNRKKQLIRQFLTESMFISFLAFGFALAIVSLYPAYTFNRLTEKEMSLQTYQPAVLDHHARFHRAHRIISRELPGFLPFILQSNQYTEREFESRQNRCIAKKNTRGDAVCQLRHPYDWHHNYLPGNTCMAKTGPIGYDNKGADYGGLVRRY